MPMPKKRVIRECLWCRGEFETGGRAGKIDKVYCSRRCQAFSRVRQPSILELNAMDMCYLAGLFDGEGSIILWDRGYGGRLQLRCTISNTFEPLMVWIKDVVGTGSTVRHVHPIETGYKDALTWQCYGQNAVAFLKQLLPRLIVRKDKAEEAIASQLVNAGGT